jgi:endonuclease/exonuclease/phosphatase family metal-dependent hydrolase
MNMILCNAPTNDSNDEDKDGFNDQLNTILEQLSNKDINILMGDFNAKIGRNNSGYEEVMGQHGVGDMNEKGERFADACVLSNFIIHKTTWISPDHMTENQIDHICICKKFRRSLLDLRVKRGADVASDHHIVA